MGERTPTIRPHHSAAAHGLRFRQLTRFSPGVFDAIAQPSPADSPAPLPSAPSMAPLSAVNTVRFTFTAVALLVCIAGAAAVAPVHAVNGLDGAMATFYPGSRCSPSSDPSLPLLQLPLATCLPNITFNSSVVGVVEHGRLSV